MTCLHLYDAIEQFPACDEFHDEKDMLLRLEDLKQLHAILMPVEEKTKKKSEEEEKAIRRRRRRRK